MGQAPVQFIPTEDRWSRIARFVEGSTACGRPA